MSDISLSKAVRSNLLSLQGTADMMATAQNRLSTGNKVNSALDNPSNWFTAKGLSNRSSDLNALMDSMANGIQTLKAADNGLSAMTKTLESMQSTLRQARQDKSFQTLSLDVSKTATGTIGFSAGAIGSVERTVDLQNTGLTNTAVGMNAASGAGTAGTANTAAVASTATGSANATVIAGTAGSIDVTVGGTVYAVALATGDDKTAVATKINAAVGSAVADGSGTNIVLTNAAGTGISVADTTGNTNGTTAAVFGTPVNVAGSAFVPGTSGSNTLTWGGAAVAVNKDAKISFDATIDGKVQKVEISQADVLKAGNGDSTIDSAAEYAAILASKITGTTAAASGNTITLTSSTTGASSTVALGSATVSGTNYNTDELVKTINDNALLKGSIRASNDNGKLRIENQSTQKLSISGASGGATNGVATSISDVAGNSVRAGLASQFNELRDQLDKLADDASFNGINLMRGDKLTITFNETGTSSIDIQTKNSQTINSANLGVPTSLEEKQLDSDTDIDSLLGDMKTALDSVRSQASTFGSNLSIVQNRQDFTKAMIDTLETGAGNLTLADMNEEAANLLALQTRQQLSSNSLSLASQADQSVLQLLR